MNLYLKYLLFKLLLTSNYAPTVNLGVESLYLEYKLIREESQMETVKELRLTNSIMFPRRVQTDDDGLLCWHKNWK